MQLRLVSTVAIAAALIPGPAAALPAVLVGAAPVKLRSHRSHVVVVRDGPRTVVGLQLDVLAPPMDLAIVVPVHGTVDPDSVRTLDRRLFDRLDRIAAPTLAHAWEQDPCGEPAAPTPEPPAPPTRPGAQPATFADGEYDFAVFGRVGAAELDAWMRERGFPLTAVHAAALVEHFAAGAHFVVARVDRRQVHFTARGAAVLSPFRFAFTAEPGWRLPLRAGIGHASGVQDVVIDALAHGERTAIQGTPAAPIVADLSLKPAAYDRFPSVYAALFAATRSLAVAEHAAPLPPAPADEALVREELAALGVDVSRMSSRAPLVLSRLHLRYAPAELDQDPLLIGAPHEADQRADYFVRHPWTGAVDCPAPRRGLWAPPTDPAAEAPRHVRTMVPARPVAALGPWLAEDVPSLGLIADPAGCACTLDRSADPGPPLGMLLVLALRRRRSARV